MRCGSGTKHRRERYMECQNSSFVLNLDGNHSKLEKDIREFQEGKLQKAKQNKIKQTNKKSHLYLDVFDHMIDNIRRGFKIQLEVWEKLVIDSKN